MRMTEILEARKASPAPVNISMVLNRLKTCANVLAGHPYYLDWDFQYGNEIKQRVAAIVAKHNENAHDDEYFEPLHEGDLWIEELPSMYSRLPFDKVQAEIRHEINEYQTRHGQRMDDEAGYSDPMHYIESSDWLSAMELEGRMGFQLNSAASNIGEIAHIVQVIETFSTEFLAKYHTTSGDEPIIVEAMNDGLRAAVPLLLLTLKKMV